MSRKAVQLLACAALTLLAGLFSLWFVARLLRVGEPNAELARTTREVVEAALDAQQAVSRARVAASVFRLVAVVAGVVGPLVAAYLIYRTKSQEGATPADILDVLERERLIDLKRDGGFLPEIEGRRKLTAQPEEDEMGQG